MFLFWVTSIYFEAFMSGAQRVFPLYLSYHKESSPQKSPPPEGTDGGLVSGFSFRALLLDHLLCCGDGCGLCVAGSEEPTSELQSRGQLLCRLRLETTS